MCVFMYFPTLYIKQYIYIYILWFVLCLSLFYVMVSVLVPFIALVYWSMLFVFCQLAITRVSAVDRGSIAQGPITNTSQ